MLWKELSTGTPSVNSPTVLNVATSTVNAIASTFGSEFQCRIPSGAPALEATTPTYSDHPKSSPCTLNR